MKVKICFGIISWLPDNVEARKLRIERLERLFKQLEELWPEIPVIVVCQNWKDFNPGYSKHIYFKYDRLGILKARKTLRNHFLQSEYNYLIMFDDDAIIQVDDDHAAVDYMDAIKKNPRGFCFIHGSGSSPYTDYADSQLNLCAISRDIVQLEDIPDYDPQKSEAFEDRIYSALLHFKYKDKEFLPPINIRCIHFKNPNEPAPSTWSREKKYNWRLMRENTCAIEKYISIKKELPKK